MHTRRREDPDAAAVARRAEYTAQCDDAASVEADSQRELAAGRQPAEAQLSMLSEVSVVGQEFGWADARRPRNASAAKRREPPVRNDHAAGVFGMESAPSKQRSGRDTAMELRRFMRSSIDGATSDEDDGEENEGHCVRSPAQLEGGAVGRDKRRRPLSAPLRAQSARGSLETELRREIAASKARTDHMQQAVVLQDM